MIVNHNLTINKSKPYAFLSKESLEVFLKNDQCSYSTIISGSTFMKKCISCTQLFYTCSRKPSGHTKVEIMSPEDP